MENTQQSDYKYHLMEKVVLDLTYFNRIYDLPECERYGTEQEATITGYAMGNQYIVDYEYFEGEPLIVPEEAIIRRL